jgi:hypothetical protein
LNASKNHGTNRLRIRPAVTFQRGGGIDLEVSTTARMELSMMKISSIYKRRENFSEAERGRGGLCVKGEIEKTVVERVIKE